MITFKQFLNEAKQTPQQVADLIKANCQPFLKESGFSYNNMDDSTLWRGVSGHIQLPAFSTQKVKTNRGPTDSSKEIHEVLDNYFKSKFGIKFRSNAVFTTGRCHVAEEYGDAFIVFPIGEYKYIWSPKILDAYRFFDNKKSKENRSDENRHGYGDITHALNLTSPLPPADSDEYTEIIKKYLEKVNPYIDHDLKKALGDGDGPEIMVHCAEYYTLNWYDGFTRDVVKLLS